VEFLRQQVVVFQHQLEEVRQHLRRGKQGKLGILWWEEERLWIASKT
jgi:hypothetical protein